MIKNSLVNLLYGSLESLFNLELWGISMKVQGLLLDCLPLFPAGEGCARSSGKTKCETLDCNTTLTCQGWVAEFSWLERTKRLHQI